MVTKAQLAKLDGRIEDVMNVLAPPPEQVTLVIPANWNPDQVAAVWAEHVSKKPADAGALLIVWLRKSRTSLDDEPPAHSAADQESWRTVARREGWARSA